MSKQRKILISIIFILWLQTLLIIGFIKVNGESMNNTLKDKEQYYTKDINATNIKRFDILIVDPKQTGDSIVKRVVGLPGEVVKYENGNLYINQIMIEQDFKYIEDYSNFETTLAEDEYYVLGDNRKNSVDSRQLGPIKKEEIRSKLFKS